MDARTAMSARLPPSFPASPPLFRRLPPTILEFRSCMENQISYPQGKELSECGV